MRRFLLVFALQQLAACAGSAETCAIDSDCASGFCRADHTCGASDGGGADASPLPDAPVGGCVPNHDGTIARDELPLVPGRAENLLATTDVTWDTAGTADGSGARSWDLSGALAGDQTVAVSLIDPNGQWWASDFSGATYATLLSTTSDLLGVFALTDTRLQLLGVVSPTGGNMRTELTYDPPVDVLVLPLGPSASWTVDTTVSGLAQGVAAYYTEHYDSRVDALGTMTTPYGAFPVSRVAVDLQRTVGGTFVTNRTFAFVSECYSTVATVVSQSYESGAEFTDVHEARRLAP